MTAFEWFFDRMTARRARQVLDWKTIGCNIIWFWRNLTADNDGTPDDPYAAVAAARRYLEATRAN